MMRGGGRALSSVWRRPPVSETRNLSGVWPRMVWDGIGLWCDMKLSDMMSGVGDTLFSAEEAPSFWNTELVWRGVRVPRIAWDGIGLWCDMKLNNVIL